MTGSSTLDPDNAPVLPDKSQGQGHGIGSLGPSDTSDSGSDMQGGRHGKRAQGSHGDSAIDMAADDLSDVPVEEGSNSDSQGTGERASVEPGDSMQDGADIAVDRIETFKPEENP